MIEMPKIPEWYMHEAGMCSSRCHHAEQKRMLRGFVEWGEADCPHAGYIGSFILLHKRECAKCWQELVDTLAELELPSIDKFIGSDPDFTGDQTTEEYIEDMRGN